MKRFLPQTCLFLGFVLNLSNAISTRYENAGVHPVVSAALLAVAGEGRGCGSAYAGRCRQGRGVLLRGVSLCRLFRHGDRSAGCPVARARPAQAFGESPPDDRRCPELLFRTPFLARAELLYAICRFPAVAERTDGPAVPTGPTISGSAYWSFSLSSLHPIPYRAPRRGCCTGEFRVRTAPECCAARGVASRAQQILKK